MFHKFAPFVLLAIILASNEIESYKFSHAISTADGFCRINGFKKIAVGQSGYSKRKCEKATCSKNHYTTRGCDKLDADGCISVRRAGNYPQCCPYFKCKSKF